MFSQMINGFDRRPFYLLPVESYLSLFISSDNRFYMGTIRAGITVGDINGIGLEVIIKTLAHPSIVQLCTCHLQFKQGGELYKNIVNLKNSHSTAPVLQIRYTIRKSMSSIAGRTQ
jgi:hypothetical protein